MPGSIVLKFIQFIFIPCQVEECQNILKLSGRPFAFTSYKAFLKNKKKSGTSLLALFSALILKKNASLAILLAEAFIKAKKQFLEGEGPTLNKSITSVYRLGH